MYKRAIQKEELSHDDLSHGDLAGGCKRTRILGGSRIVFGLTDDLTDLTEIHLLRKKSEAFSRLKKYAAKQEVEGNPVQRFRSDNGGKFELAACKEWMKIEGIQWEPTTPTTRTKMAWQRGVFGLYLRGFELFRMT